MFDKASAVEATIVPPESIVKSDNRRDWALMIVSGGAMAMTLFAAVCLYLVADNPNYVFYLGLAAMIQIFMVFTGLLGLLVKRNLKISKGEISVSDMTDTGEYIGDDDVVPRKKVEQAVENAVESVPAVRPDVKKEVEATGVPSDNSNLKS